MLVIRDETPRAESPNVGRRPVRRVAETYERGVLACRRASRFGRFARPTGAPSMLASLLPTLSRVADRMRDRSRLRSDGLDLALLVAFAGYVALVVRTAWVSDDSFITMRTVDNWVHGHGLTWNPVERVQAYTHPLFLFVVAAAYFVT